MSSTTLWRVYRTTVRTEAEFRNSWGSAPPLWDMLGFRYLDFRVPATMASESQMQALWKLARHPIVPEHLRIALACTFDYALIRPEHVEAAAAAFDLTHRDILAEPPRHMRFSDKPREPMTWSHWPAIAAALRAAKADHRLMGWGIGCTSISDPWANYNLPRTREPFDAVEHARLLEPEKKEDAA